MRETATRVLRRVLSVMLALAFAPAAAVGLSRHAAAAETRGQPAAARAVVLVLVDAFSFADIDATLTPNLWKLASIGAVGLSNARTARTQELQHAYVTLGAGTRAQGPLEAGHAFNSDERAEGDEASLAHARNTGQVTPAPPGRVVHPYVALIRRANSDATYEIVPGALGGALGRAGKRTAVFGNSDSFGYVGRHAAAIAMDEEGIVDLGDVGQGTARASPGFPGGLVTHVEHVVSRASEALARGYADFVVVETGDTARVERYARAGLLTPVAEERARRLALSSADLLIGRLMDSLDLVSAVLIVLAPTPRASEAATGHGLAPVIAVGGGLERGLLTSSTTRRRGLVANTDIAASVLSYLGVGAPRSVLGTPMRVAAGVSPRAAPPAVPPVGYVGYLVSLHDRIAAVSMVRAPLLKAFVALQIAAALASLFFIGAAAIAEGSRTPHIVRRLGFPRALHALLALLGAVPLAWLILPVFAAPSLGVSSVLTAAFASLAWGLGRASLGRPSTAFAAVYLATGLVIMADAAFGAELMKDSVLGYDLVGGARFFGVGNEYMGALVGSLIAGAGLALDALGARARRALPGVAAVFVLATAVLASPSAGANMGGTLTAAAGFGAAYLLFSGRKVAWRQAGLLALLASILVVGAAFADSLRPGGPVSHWGRTVLLARAGGVGTLVDALRRKAAMNLKLIRYTAWTRALFAFLGALVILWVRPVGPVKRLMRGRPGFVSALASSMVAVAVALIVNDSGVVAAAMIALYPSLALLYLAGEDASRDA